MNFDIAIVIGFLLITNIVGFICARGVNSIKKYAIGTNEFSTATIAATLAATWIGGGFFTVTITNTYSDGIYYIILGLCEVLAFFVLAFFVAPRIGVFLGDLSIAESMGRLYGKPAQIITALAGIARVTGTIAIQFQVCSTKLGIGTESYTFPSLTFLFLMISASLASSAESKVCSWATVDSCGISMAGARNM